MGVSITPEGFLCQRMLIEMDPLYFSFRMLLEILCQILVWVSLFAEGAQDGPTPFDPYLRMDINKRMPLFESDQPRSKRSIGNRTSNEWQSVLRLRIGIADTKAFLA
jgi:hypothetical protein